MEVNGILFVLLTALKILFTVSEFITIYYHKITVKTGVCGAICLEESNLLLSRVISERESK